jgi:hypothetical protein
MACVWVLLASRITDERLCGKPGQPYCRIHQREIDVIQRAEFFSDEEEPLGLSATKRSK